MSRWMTLPIIVLCAVPMSMWPSEEMEEAVAQPYRTGRELMQEVSEKVSGELERIKKSIEQLRADRRNRDLKYEVERKIDSIDTNLQKILRRYDVTKPQSMQVFWEQRPPSLKKFGQFMDWTNKKMTELLALRQEVSDLTTLPAHARTASTAISPRALVSPGRMRSATAAGGQPLTRSQLQEVELKHNGAVKKMPPPIMVPSGGIRVMPAVTSPVSK